MFDCYLELSGEVSCVGINLTIEQARKAYFRYIRRGRLTFIACDTGFTYNTLEEIKNVKNIRSSNTVRLDLTNASGVKIPESSDRELFGSSTDNSESSSERDNKWDKLT